MKKLLLSISIILFLCSSSYATVIFSDDFEDDLSQWTGKSGGSYSAQIVADPLQSDKAINFSAIASAGDIFTSATAFSAGTYWLSFDYLGSPVSLDSGGYVGISVGLPGSHTWLWATGTVSGADDVLIDDGTWHSYTFMFNTAYSFHLMIEDHISPAANAYFDNISLSDTAPVPEPATMMLFGLGLLGLAGLSRRKK
ncbi:MAG: PEP-CTERM sorting domain-containing protein [Proteobacteria bacterium]|nr:PEP-CTERM sorting domain-containing protein [Pseudomonadota bacterium]MBU1388799.1 PEP-CTERM sorting domain-containing protein [Pseudomonadota bacterium]MBU1543140.1 PEP-CTERM sorting domain-containing protein [Pseudomonadota bacterium]MBU2482599.1 PEP-CTERM sorting domain-containing protein [Pseudomonadota bacterium]